MILFFLSIILFLILVALDGMTLYALIYFIRQNEFQFVILLGCVLYLVMSITIMSMFIIYDIYSNLIKF